MDCSRAVILGFGDVERAKPWPDLFLLAAQRMAVPPQDCVVLEDSEKGVLAAAAANMRCIAVPNEHTSDHDFSKAWRIVPSLLALTPESLEKSTVTSTPESRLQAKGT